MTGILLILLVLIAVLLTQIVDLRRQGEVRAIMDGVLTHRGQATLDEIALIVRENKHYLGRHVVAARRLRAQGRQDEAVEHLRLGASAIQELAPGFLDALRTLRGLARCVSAIVVVEPVRASAFRTASLKGLAGVGSVLHYLLLTGRQRVALRLRVVAGAFGLAVRWMCDATARVARRDSDRQWRRVDALVADIGTTGDEALVATRQIAEALDAVEFGPALAGRAR
jgi:hypothetical protein